MDSIHAGSISQPPDQWRDPMCISRVSRSESPHCGCLTCATETVYDGRVMKTALDRASSLLIFLLLLAGLGILPTAAQSRTTPNAQLVSKEVNARVDALVKQMTLDEKIGQLVSYSAGFATGPAASNLTLRRTGGQGPGWVHAERGRRREPPITISTLPWKNRVCTSRSSLG